MTTAIRRFTSPQLTAAIRRVDWSEWWGWKLDDGTEVLRVHRTLLVALPDGRVLRRSSIPTDVPVKTLTTEMIRRAS